MIYCKFITNKYPGGRFEAQAGGCRVQAELNDLTIRLPRKSTLNTTRTESATSRLNQLERPAASSRRGDVAQRARTHAPSRKTKSLSAMLSCSCSSCSLHDHPTYTPSSSCGLPTPKKTTIQTKNHHQTPSSNIRLDSLHSSRRSFNQLTAYFLSCLLTGFEF